MQGVKSSYETIRSNRRLVAVSAIMWMAGAVLFMLLVTIDSGVNSALTPVAVSAVVLPGVLAMLSLDRRPSLLPVAALAAVAAGLASATLLFIGIVFGLLWWRAHSRRLRPPANPTGLSWKRPLLAAAVALPLVVLNLPSLERCVDSDGTVVETVVDATGTTSFTSSAGTICSSNPVETWEAALSLACSLAVLGLALRWPTSERLQAGSEAD